jgi:hypothetical protein
VDFKSVPISHVKLEEGTKKLARSSDGLIATEPLMKMVVEMPTHRVGAICRIYTSTVKQEPDSFQVLALAFAKRVHQLGKGGGSLDFKEDFVVVVRHFDVEVFGLGLFVGVAASSWGLTVVGHFGCFPR